MTTDWTCNVPSWTKEEDRIFENTLAMHYSDDDLLMKMAALLPGKSLDDIVHHYQVLIEDIEAIESGKVPLPKYTRMRSHPQQKSRKSKVDVERRKGVAWSEEEHRSFLQGLEKYGRGDWRSISRFCVLSRTPTQVASHAQKFFCRLKAVNKERRRTSIHDITIARTGTAGTSQLPNPENVAVGAVGNENKLPEESLYPDANDDSILGLDDLIMEQEEGTYEAGFTVDTGKSILPSTEPPAAAGNESHPLTRIGSELEALITEHMVEDTELSSIFDIQKPQPSHPMLSNAAAYSGIPSYTVGSTSARNARGNTVGLAGQLPSIVPSDMLSNAAAYSGMSSYVAGSTSAGNARGNMVAAPGGDLTVNPGQLQSFAPSGMLTNAAAYNVMPSYMVASTSTGNAHGGGLTVDSGHLRSFEPSAMVNASYSVMPSYTVASAGAMDVCGNTVAAPGGGLTGQLPSSGMLSNAASYNVMPSYRVGSTSAGNARGNTVADPGGGFNSGQLPSSSGFSYGVCPNPNDENIFDLEDLFKDPMDDLSWWNRGHY